MPAKSKKQLKFMQAVANNPDFAKKVGIPQSVGKEFTKEKKVKKYEKGGQLKHATKNEKLYDKLDEQTKKMYPYGEFVVLSDYEKAVLRANPKGREVKMAAGGVVSRGAKIIQKQISSLKDKLANNPDRISGGAEAGKKRLQELEGMSQNYDKAKQAAERSEYLIPKGEKSLRRKPDMKKGGSVKKMAKGGKVSSCSKRADGCAIKGKTKGRMV